MHIHACTLYNHFTMLSTDSIKKQSAVFYRTYAMHHRRHVHGGALLTQSELTRTQPYRCMHMVHDTSASARTCTCMNPPTNVYHGVANCLTQSVSPWHAISIESFNWCAFFSDQIVQVWIGTHAMHTNVHTCMHVHTVCTYVLSTYVCSGHARMQSWYTCNIYI